MTFKFDEVRVDQGTTATLEDGEPYVENAMDCLKDLVCGEDILTAHVTVTTLTGTGVRRHELVLDNENAKLHKTSLDAIGDIAESSELYRQLTTAGATATMVDGDSLVMWLGNPHDEKRLLLNAPEVRESMDMRLSKFW
mgnify:CR=1 FL=1